VAQLRRLLRNRLTSRELTALRLLAALDSAVLVAAAYGALTHNTVLLLLLLPTCSSLYLALVATMTVFAERRRVSWWLASTILVVGPLGGAVVLGACRPGRRTP
jgi:hypothetical protein